MLTVERHAVTFVFRREGTMKLLPTIVGVLGVVCLVIAIILQLAGVCEWIATPVGWWRMTMALLLLSVALEVVKPFQKKGAAS